MNWRCKAELFVRTWQESSSVGEVSKKLGQPDTKLVYARAAYLKKVGVKLKQMTTSRSGRVDVAALNAIVDESSAGESVK